MYLLVPTFLSLCLGGVCLLRLVWVFESKVSLDSSFLWGTVDRQKGLTL